jgi:hypothetical protein
MTTALENVRGLFLWNGTYIPSEWTHEELTTILRDTPKSTAEELISIGIEHGWLPKDITIFAEALVLHQKFYYKALQEFYLKALKLGLTKASKFNKITEKLLDL